MRMINDINKILDVTEIISMDASPCWCENEGTSEENPSLFGVGVFEATVNGNEYMELGCYNLDGTPETYRKAVENFNSICMKAAMTGYFRLSDFENFELY